ncbi:putative translation initiation factor eIF-2B subunit [Suhomyces tanzawaensis NRRL Y-17324]|uniref:Translation initiation factor eIF2B subunit delta n=1 Tax=Suhomyces tanzawaensis NRRL Y-17324 TaxID=984487 RepID=A0A1E4SIQ5_9ASCO|nr:putative translation initiation factor eIF-2B subunit [Suhomyces tanzawaensis NRRL Y-17324]ODV79378.1 putative translation initiation factor eIF-2B subunit [Suhomyces tanzawaensis NRRL Y-17324]
MAEPKEATPQVEAPKAEVNKTADAVDPKKLSNKELKELKKKEKAAKRAAQKEAIGISPEQQAQIAQQKIEKKKQAATNTNLKKQLNQTLIKDNGTKNRVPSLFSHLETREQRNASSPSISHLVHPSILSLTLKYSSFKIVGSIPRLRSMMEVFKRVIQDYQTPANTTLTRHLTGHLSIQIEYLKTARPLSISMGNAIRWLKQEISHISIDTTDQQAKDSLCQSIDDFIRDKIDLSDKLIITYAANHITNGSNVLTFGHSQVLEDLFKYCVLEQDKKFNLIVVDSRPLFEGKKLLNNLVKTTKNGVSITQDIKITYVLINSLSSTILKDVDCAFLGVHAMLSNGRLYSRVGTGLIAMMCHTRNIPVLTCCESIKFSDKVQLDSVTNNELADCDDLIEDINSKKPPQKKSFALEQFIQQCEAESKDTKTKQPTKKGQANEVKEVQDTNKSPLQDWRNMPSLNILNVMYDLTPPEYIKKVVTELGALPPSSVPVILREYKNT